MNGSPSSSPSTSSAPSTSEAKICLVCGAENASRHYGAITCGRCKVFFIRAVTVDKDYKCHAAGKCTYPESKCRSCRYNRCIEVGMIPETVARREGCTRQLKRFSKPKLDEEDRQEAQLPQFDEEIDVETPMEIDFVAFQRELKNEALNAQKPPSPPTFEEDDDLCDQQPSTSRGLCSHSPDPLQALVDQFELPNNNLSIVPSLTWAMKTFGANMSLWIPKDSTDVGGQLVALDKVCSKDNSDTSSITPFSIALNMSIADLLDNPEIIAPRGPLGFSETAPVTTDRTQLTHMVFARKLIYYIDWLRGTKEFWMLGDSDRKSVNLYQRLVPSNPAVLD